MYNAKKGQPFYTTLSILGTFFTYPNGIGQDELKIWKMKAWLSKCATYICVALTIIHLIALIRADVGADISEDLSVIIGGGGAGLGSIFFMMLDERWSKFLYKIQDFTEFGEPPTFNSVFIKMNKIGNYAFFYGLCGSSIYGVVNTMSTSTCEELRKQNVSVVCGLFVPTSLPFEINLIEKWSIFIIMFIICACLMAGSLQIHYFVNEVTQILSSHIEHLKDFLTGGFVRDRHEENKSRLRLFIRYHIHILNMCDEMKRLVKLTTGLSVLIAAVAIGILLNQILIVKPLSALILLIGWMVGVFAICHAGQQITDKVYSINEAVYFSNWYDLNPQLAKDLKFILLRTQIPFGYESMPFGAMNYPTFMAIVKTSFSYLTLLNKKK